MSTTTISSIRAAQMADGLNQARAMRTAEVISQFRVLQHQIATFKATPSPEEKDMEGFKLLRQCISDGQAILKAPFAATSEPPGGDLEKEKTQLKQVMLDAASRRFMAQRVYLKATAAMRWINSRNAILQGKKPEAAHMPALAIVDTTLRTELATITDAKIVRDLSASDQAQGKWTQEDPDVVGILRFITLNRTQGSSR